MNNDIIINKLYKDTSFLYFNRTYISIHFLPPTFIWDKTTKKLVMHHPTEYKIYRFSRTNAHQSLYNHNMVMLAITPFGLKVNWAGFM